MINWFNPKDKVSKYFTVHEALYLPTWGIYHTPSETEQINIISTALVMDEVREILDRPIIVHAWVRPIKVDNISSPRHGMNYNNAIGGAGKSAHVDGLAVDWHCEGLTIDETMDIIQPKCEELEFSLENNGSVSRIANNGGMGGPRNWVHLQIRPLVFKPYWRIFNT
jgi:hypothetical protein